MKFGIISPSFSPSDMGQSIVLNRLLKTFNADEYCMIASQYYGKFKDQNFEKKIYFPFSLPQGIQRLLLQTHLESFYIKFRARQFKKILKKENCRCVINCTSDLFASNAALLAADDLHIPFILYSFDDYSFQWAYDRIYYRFAKETEESIFRRSKSVIVPNEFLSDEYFNRFGIKSIIIRNPLETGFFAVQCDEPEHDTIKIVYAGSIYEVHFDAFKALIQALNRIKNAELHIYTNQSLENLKKEGISSPQVFFHNSVPYADIPKLYQCSDILYLPLAFNSPYPETTIRTSSPGKMGEYLATGKPILVHAPDYSFLAWYFRKNSCGVVVDGLEPGQIVDGIFKALNGTDYSEINRELAKSYDLATQKKKLIEICKRA
jgi:UDP-N-acetylglucosamine:LPS N-acetylglucosamine transferase